MGPNNARRFCYIVAMLAVLASACGDQPPADRSEPASSIQPGTAGTSGSVPPSASQSDAAAPAAALPEEVERDADAIKALEGMSRYLRTLEAFQLRSETSRDEVLDSGQKVEFDGVVDMLVERPNRLRAEVTSDKQQRLYFADGTTFSVWARRVNYYATIPAPATLGELADTLANKYNLELPIVDLFYWGSDRKSSDDIVGAIDVGASQVDGVTCEHYAFRQEDVDWQIWIQQGGFPLPRKLVITTTTDAARPQFTSVMTWNLAPSYNETAFTFVPPKDAKKITIAERPTSSSEQ